MRIAVLGAGPAGLYAATLWKLRHPADAVRVIEQNPADATWGFGVVFSDKALEFLRADDPATVDLITPRMEQWRDITVAHRGETIAIDGVGFSAIGRLELLQLLIRRAREAGVELVHDHAVKSLDELADADLIIGADGLNSLVRRTYEADFGTSLGYLDNKFAWYGTTKRFETLTQTFVESPYGSFNAHHYRYSDTMSTFIVECDRQTWLKAGLGDMGEAASLELCQEVFKDALDGHPLIANRSVWRNFPTLWCRRWTYRNMALLGDAAHTAHFSIGSGTRLALEDAIALVKALEAHPGDIPAGLAAYDAARRPIARKIVDAALASAAWYEDFAEHMALPPYAFATSYIMRTGRLDRDKLAAMSPRFAAASERALTEERAA
jgi:2-polyprenyl-6-methoxyphenol hydroxylase-like FAD-dependent oxidoreductase